MLVQKDDRGVEQGQYLFEILTVGGAGSVSVNPPPGYFFLSSAPCGEWSPKVMVTWRKVLNETDPGPAPPATAAGNVRRLKPAKKAKKKASKRAPGRR